MNIFCITTLSTLPRFVKTRTDKVSDLLDDLVDSKDSHLSQLRLIWGSGLIKEEIMKELVKYWNREARLGRTLEEAAR